jgi:arsenate reductase
MAERTYNVLFVCTGNSARSILAEAILNDMGRGRGFQAFSAGSQPKGQVHPSALKILATHRLPTDGYRSKPWDEFAQPGAPVLDFVFTVCDQAAGEVCPVWPGQPMTAHWGMPDPAAIEGPQAVIDKAFLDTFITLKRRIELMLALPLASLDKLALQREITAIGTR